MQRTDEGTYLEVGGRPAVRFERVYPQSVERVWRSISEPAQIRQWFPSPSVSIDVDARTITLAGDPYSPDASTTKVLVWEPPHRFSFEWESDELHFTLTEHEGGTRLELVNVLSKDGAASRNAAGWEMCLGHLDRTVAGTWAPSPTDGSMADFLPVLEKYKERGLPDDGWLPDPPA